MKKIVSLILAVVLVAGMASVAFGAAGGWKPIGFRSAEELGGPNFDPYLEQGEIETDAFLDFYLSQAEVPSLDLGTVRPGEKLILATSPDYYEWEYPEDSSIDLRWTPRVLKSAGFRFGVQVAAGSRTVDGRTFSPVLKDFVAFGEEYDDAVTIVIPFVEELVSTDSVDFDFTFYATLNGERRRYNFTGTLENETFDLGENETFADTSQGEVFEAQAAVRNLEINPGADVTLFANVFERKKYYAKASLEMVEPDSELAKANEGLVGNLKLNTVGFTNATVKLGEPYKDYYIYDEEFNFLGMGDAESLPLRISYYLCTKELAVEIIEETEVPGVDEPETTVAVTDEADTQAKEVNGPEDVA
ncbi:MAG: hypothetical protein ACK5LX_04570 [Oscillospiraceae bacterium]